MPGCPDFIVPCLRLVIFVHGCFWYGHDGCRKGRTRPGSNARFWEEKISCNIARHRRSARLLRAAGFKVLTVWECRLNRRIPQIIEATRSDRNDRPLRPKSQITIGSISSSVT